jgi:protein phosphatase 4 regulatory subunit 3
MTRHESKIRELAQSPLGGERFQLFIKKWEMNNEPPPPTSLPKYVYFFYSLRTQTEWLSRHIDGRTFPQHVRSLDTEEENYFNEDEEEESHVQPISQPLRLAPQVPINSLKRKRRMALASAAKGFRPTPRTPSRMTTLDQLSDYSEDDDETVPVDADSPDPTLSLSARKPPPSLRLAHKDDDDEDNLLANIARRSPRPESPSPGLMASTSSLGAVRLSEKRRRDDDDDDELNDLVKTKKPDLGGNKDSGVISGHGSKSGDDPPKKLKLKLESSSLGSAASASNTPSDKSTKEGSAG